MGASAFLQSTRLRGARRAPEGGSEGSGLWQHTDRPRRQRRPGTRQRLGSQIADLKNNAWICRDVACIQALRDSALPGSTPRALTFGSHPSVSQCPITSTLGRTQLFKLHLCMPIGRRSLLRASSDSKRQPRDSSVADWYTMELPRTLLKSKGLQETKRHEGVDRRCPRVQPRCRTRAPELRLAATSCTSVSPRRSVRGPSGWSGHFETARLAASGSILQQVTSGYSL